MKKLPWILTLIIAVLATIFGLYFTETGRRLRRKYVNPDEEREKAERKYTCLDDEDPDEDPEFFEDFDFLN